MKAGWLLPNREFVECELFAHLEVVANNASLRKLVPDTIFSNLEEVELWCQELADSGDHPEWHCYEMARDDANDKVRDILLDAGCYRVGRVGNRLYFECSIFDPIMMQYAKDLAESQGLTADFEKA